MNKVAKAAKKLFGGGDADALAAQQRALRKRESDVAAAEAGQRRARSSNRGLLAFIDEDLSSTFGGG